MSDRGCISHVRADNGVFWEPFFSYPLSEGWKGLMSGNVGKHSAVVKVGNPSIYPRAAILLWAKRDVNGVWRQQDSIQASPISEELPWYHFKLEDLSSGSEYSFFVVDENQTNRSVYGKFKTAPSKCNKKPVRFAVSSCNGYADSLSGQKYSFTNTGNLSKMPTEDLDFHIQVGDLCYADFVINNRTNPIPFPGYENFVGIPSAYIVNTPYQFRPALTVKEFVEAWISLSFESPNVRDQLRSTSIFYMNDDHEFYDNWSSKGNIVQYTQEQVNFMVDYLRLPPLPDGKLFTQNDIKVIWGFPNIPPGMFQNGFKTMESITMLKPGNNSVGPGTNPSNRWYTFSWGATVDVLVLDMDNDRGNGLQLFSQEQWKFIKTTLLKSKKPFKFIACPKVMLITNNRPIQDQYDEILATFIFNNITYYNNRYSLELLQFMAGQYLWINSGDYINLYVNGFPDNIPGCPKPEPSRDMLLEFIVENKINGVYFVSGDIHFGSLGHVGDSNVPSQPDNPFGNPIHPITPEGNLWEIICSSTGSPYGRLGQFIINDFPDNTMFYSMTRTNTHTVITADAEHHKLIIEWVSSTDTKKDILNLDENFNVKKTCTRKCHSEKPPKQNLSGLEVLKNASINKLKHSTQPITFDNKDILNKFNLAWKEIKG